FPLLVTKEDKKRAGTFYGCVARGIVYLEHIIPVSPAEVIIERYLPRDSAYLGSLFGGLVTVNLPELKRQHSHLRCLPGEKVSVYFENYNLTLTNDPSGKKNDKGHLPPISVTTIQPAQIGNLGGYQLFMAVDESLLASIDDERFYSSESQWTLLEFNIETTEFSLGKATVQIICRLTETGNGLKVVSVLQTKTSQLGIDIPFELVLISQDLDPESIFSWQYGVEQLFQFATQATLNQQLSELRIKQAKFFRRWQAILDYQKQHESQREVEYEGTLISIGSSSKLIIPRSAYSLTADDQELDISDLFKTIQKSNGNLKPEHCCQLQSWNYDKQTYVPALENRKNKPDYRLTESGDFEIEGRFYINHDSKLEPHRFKFTITLPNAPLQRQQQALEAFFEDRLIELRLKDILLMPSSYQPEQDDYWKNHDIQWQAELTPSQKQVVEAALKAKHIALIQGPPGTGKTTAIVEMLSQLLSQNPHQRILVVSQQNTAVDNALSRFKDKKPKLVENSVNIVRIGNP
ncbi:MAG: AAA domain-containing protein, partial [Flavisolibacter sp.]